MTEQRNTVHVDVLEEAIETVVQDLRVPVKLRTALAVYQSQRTGIANRRPSLLRAGFSGLSEDSGGVIAVCQRDDSRSSSDEQRTIGSRVRTTLEEGIEIRLWFNDQPLDWSVEINGQRHEHVSYEVMEALVECAVIVAETSVTKVLVLRPQ